MHVPHVLTFIAAPGHTLTLDYLAGPLTSSGLLFEGITWLQPQTACDLVLHQPPAPQSYAETLVRAANSQVDVVLQPLAGRAKKLLISDMDSTMIHQECIDELADHVGRKAEVSRITERAMNGELDFKAALVERVALLQGLPERVLQQVFDRNITLMDGAKTLLATMKSRGASTHLVSGGSPSSPAAWLRPSGSIRMKQISSKFPMAN